MEWSSTTLRVVQAIAEAGSFTRAADALGYTQSAVSRQVAQVERTVGAVLFERGVGGVRITAAGETLLAHASAALETLDRAESALRGAGTGKATVRLGVFTSAGAALVPRALASLRRRGADITVITRESSTPALVRSLRASTLDLAVISSRSPYPPPDDERPRLRLDVLTEGDLLVAVAATSGLGADGAISLAELQQAQWIVSSQSPGEPRMGIWPGLPQRPRVAHQATDWMTKMALVAGGFGVTTVPPYLAALVPETVRLLTVLDGPPVTRRVLLARLPRSRDAALETVASSLEEAAAALAAG